MSKFIGVVIGAVELAVAAVLLIPTAGASFWLAQLGVGTLIASAGTLLLNSISSALGGGDAKSNTGVSVATRNAISPWNVIYGRAVAGGKFDLIEGA